jgi:hypothetical protein
MTDVPYRWVVDTRDGQTRIDWKWLVLTLVAGAVTTALAFLLLPAWVAAIVVLVVALGSVIAEVVIRKRTSP